MSDDFTDGLIELLARLEAAQRAKTLRLENPYVLHLVAILLPRGTRGMWRRDVIDALLERRKSAGLPIPRKFDDAVQSAFQRYCRQSDIFIKRGAPEELALFYWPKKGSGLWAADTRIALAWAKRHDAPGHLPVP